MGRLKYFLLIAFVCAFILTPILMIFYWPALSRLEGRHYPVVENVELLSVGTIDEGELSFWQFDKVRNCKWLDLTFYEGKRDGVFSIIITDLNPDGGIDTSRPTGDNVAGPWLHYTTSPPNNWFADVRHRCHPLWITRTRFWN